MNVNSANSNIMASNQVPEFNASSEVPNAQAPSKTIDFTGVQAQNSIHKDTSSSLNSLFEQLSALISQLLGKTATAESTIEPEAAYEVDSSLEVSNMTKKKAKDISVTNISIHNKDGSSEDPKGATGFSRKANDHSFTLANGTSIPRNSDPTDVHARLEAFTADSWKASDNKTHTFKAQYDIGDIQPATTIFQIKDSKDTPSLFARVYQGNNPSTKEKEGSDNYYLKIQGKDVDNQDFNLKLEKDGTPAKFTLEAESDGKDFSIKVQNQDDQVVSGKHSGKKDNLTFRWGLYNNEPADQTSTAKINDIKIT